jgi:hypothetical protein
MLSEICFILRGIEGDMIENIYWLNNMEHQLDATITVLPVKQLPSYRTHSAKQQRPETLPTTSTGHYTICCKKSQSCATEDG